ncbi:hypothetical protein [Pseudomonas sp. EA_35y_Pfl2_R111]|uniref:hypothetical protein n=1 Tax=Pseudomonas sp. EA_35y_Pfl2_R111 TaxID=3088689 RepID=UPI0030D7D425
MSFSHKAFIFDWLKFQHELLPTLRLALQRNETEPLVAFIEIHLGAIKDPYEGEPLPQNWRSQISVGDVQELGDFALTRYYQPTEDFGLSEEWGALSESLSALEKAALLGTSLAEAGTAFDPGRMGAYFQRPEEVCLSLQILQQVGHQSLEPFIAGLLQAAALNKGLYVTF